MHVTRPRGPRRRGRRRLFLLRSTTKQFESTDDAFIDGHIVQMDAKSQRLRRGTR